MPLESGAACVTTTGALKRPWLYATCWDSELLFGATAGLECRDGLVSFLECRPVSGIKCHVGCLPLCSHHCYFCSSQSLIFTYLSAMVLLYFFD